MRTDLELILLVDQKNAIAAQGKQAIFISEDLKHFKKKTLGQVVIMGRKTFQAIGGPLPERTNILLSQTLPPQGQDILLARDLEGLWDILESIPRDKKVFSIGGALLCETLLPYTSRAWLTRIDHEIQGADTFIEDFSQNPQWVLEEKIPMPNKDYKAWIENWKRA